LKVAAKDKLNELQLRVRQLLDQAEQITKEQNYQRYREERFRQTSESTNVGFKEFAFNIFPINSEPCSLVVNWSNSGAPGHWMVANASFEGIFRGKEACLKDESKEAVSRRDHIHHIQKIIVIFCFSFILCLKIIYLVPD
jgi:hypothetical protein